MIKADDKVLYNYTIEMMANITEFYLIDYPKTSLFRKSDDINKLIELDVSKKIAVVLPNKFTEAEVTVAKVADKLIVSVTFSIDGEAELVVIHEQRTAYDPTCLYFGCGFSIGYKQREEKTVVPVIEKPKIDFSTISSLSAPTNNGLPRFTNNMHVAVDLAKVDVHQEYIDRVAKEMADQTNRQMLQSIIATTPAIPEWGVSTAGWTKETTTWDEISHKPTSLGYIPNIGDFGGVITTDNTTPAWYTYDTSTMEKISFSELIDLVNDVQSEVMKFE